MRNAVMKSGRNLDSLVRSVKKLKAGFHCRARGFEVQGGSRRGSIRACRAPSDLLRLDDGDLGSHSALCAELKILSETRLRGPVPKIAGSGQRRDANLRQRLGFPWRDQGLL